MGKEGNHNLPQNLADKKSVNEKLTSDLEAEIMGRDIPEAIASIEAIPDSGKKKEILKKTITSFKTELEKLEK